MSAMHLTTDLIGGDSFGLLSATRRHSPLQNNYCNVAHCDAGGRAVHSIRLDRSSIALASADYWGVAADGTGDRSTLGSSHDAGTPRPAVGCQKRTFEPHITAISSFDVPGERAKRELVGISEGKIHKCSKRGLTNKCRCTSLTGVDALDGLN